MRKEGDRLILSLVPRKSWLSNWGDSRISTHSRFGTENETLDMNRICLC